MIEHPELVDLKWFRDDDYMPNPSGHWYFVTARTKDGSKYVMNSYISDEVIVDEAICREILSDQMLGNIVKAIEENKK